MTTLPFCKRCFELNHERCFIKSEAFSYGWFVRPPALDLNRELMRLHQKKHKLKKRYNTCLTKINKYFITLTAGAVPKEYENAISRILKYKKFKIDYGYGVIELTKSGQPHAHIYLETKEYLRKERVKRIWKKSFIDIKNVKIDNGIKNYCEKDKDNTKLLEFCRLHNIQRLQETDHGQPVALS